MNSVSTRTPTIFSPLVGVSDSLLPGSSFPGKKVENRCGHCGRFRAWEDLTLVDDMYPLVDGAYGEDIYYVCSAPCRN